MKKIIKTSLLFVCIGFFVSLVVFFLLFGEGIQFTMPCILLVFFFVSLFVLEKIPFIKKRPFLKYLLYALLVVAAIMFI